jgi:RimJ/RimL family protein N-acetyltransferase
LGPGFAVEGTKAFVDYMSSTHAPKRFIIEMDTRNRASVKVAVKLGFDFVKLINNAAFLKNFVSHKFQFFTNWHHIFSDESFVNLTT